MKNIVDQNVWDKSYDNFNFYVANDVITDKFDEIITQYGIKIEGKTCLEIGCFPCRYLTHFGKKYNMIINGVDRTSHLNARFLEWLKLTGCRVGDVRCQDFIEYIDACKREEKMFDLVYSVGFIEHFTDYLKVIHYHCEVVRPGGTLILECPNFRGDVQHFLHSKFDAENLSRHVIESMDPDKWTAYLENHGFEVIDNGYFGGFKFWYGVQKRNIIHKILCKLCSYVCRLLSHIIKSNSPKYSPYCILVAKRKY